MPTDVTDINIYCKFMQFCYQWMYEPILHALYVNIYKFISYIYIYIYHTHTHRPVLHDWCNKGCGMSYPVCGMVHIKEPLLLIDKSSLCGSSRFPFSLSEWSLTISLTPYNCR